jgi:CelD/BcsL family acetyltransferase involved in cellulose biosynthesis
MQFTLHKDFDDITADAWNALAHSSISDTPFARHEYLRQWWRTLGGGEWDKAELILVSASEAGRLVGIAPLFKADHEGRAALMLVGSIEISDYLDLIVGKEDLTAFASGLLDLLQQAAGLPSVPMDWYNVPDWSPTLRVLEAEAQRRGWDHAQEIYRAAPSIALGGDFEAFLGRLDKKQRHEIRRKLRRAAEGPTPASFHLVEDSVELEPAMDAFFELMAHDADKAEFLKPQMREHMRRVIRDAFANGYLWLAFLDMNGAKAAAALNFDYGNKLWGYNSGVSRDFADLSPGWVLLAHEIQWAVQHGRYEFDFMRGDEDYKYRFGASNRYVLRLKVSAK